MTANGDDPVASWHERVGSLRKRGRVSAALTVVPPDVLDVRRARPPAPERLSKEERERWDQLVGTRRPSWFAGSDAILESYIIRVTQMQRLEAALRKVDPGTGDRYQKLARTHRQTVALAASLAVKLRLVPSTRLDKRTPQDGELPVG